MVVPSTSMVRVGVFFQVLMSDLSRSWLMRSGVVRVAAPGEQPGVGDGHVEPAVDRACGGPHAIRVPRIGWRSYYYDRTRMSRLIWRTHGEVHAGPQGSNATADDRDGWAPLQARRHRRRRHRHVGR